MFIDHGVTLYISCTTARNHITLSSVVYCMLDSSEAETLKNDLYSHSHVGSGDFSVIVVLMMELGSSFILWHTCNNTTSATQIGF